MLLVFALLITPLIYLKEPLRAHKLSVNQSCCRPGALLLCQDWWMFGASRRRGMRPRKNKRTKTSLQRRRKKQSKQLSYIINLPQRWILAPTWLPYNTRDPRLRKNVAGVRSESVFECVCLEWYCVQLQRDRTSVGCSQARSQREM